MPFSVSDVSWGSYRDNEGPALYARKKLAFEPQDFLDRAMLVTSAAEGNPSAINMYDSCIMTAGCIQFCDRGTFAVCDMLGKVADTCGLDYLLQALDPALKVSNATFRRNPAGKWRFFLDGGATEVSTVALQQRLYLNGPGTRGSWTPTRRLYAMTWCAAMGSVWDDVRAVKAQVDFTKPRLMQFVSGATRTLFSDPNVPDVGWAGMLKAAVVSYCINSPANVSKAVSSFGSTFAKWSPEWCLDVLYAVTFVGVDTFRARYDAIRPVLETQFGVTLPKNSGELGKKGWHTMSPTDVVVEPPRPVAEEIVQKIARPSVPPSDPSSLSGALVFEEPQQLSSPNAKFAWTVHLLVVLFGFWGRVVSEILKLFGRN